jgi:hypothetical protein
LRVARPMLPGRLLDPVSNGGARGMITILGFSRGNRTRLTDPLPLFFLRDQELQGNIFSPSSIFLFPDRPLG